MDDNEDDYLMLSGIQHFQFCRRQWALIHIEQQWQENVKTVEGQHLHRKADQPFIREKRGDKLIVRAMPVKSQKLQITGICDVVEFLRDDSAGVKLSGEKGKFIPVPIEYKHGKPKVDDADILQLTAQAICLEEMLLCEISKGYIYYHEIKHRIEIDLMEYKSKVRTMVREMQDYYRRRYTPMVKTGKFCQSCSLQDICLPKLMHKRSVRSYIEGKISE